jgi:hypothetical protein
MRPGRKPNSITTGLATGGTAENCATGILAVQHRVLGVHPAIAASGIVARRSPASKRPIPATADTRAIHGPLPFRPGIDAGFAIRAIHFLVSLVHEAY